MVRSAGGLQIIEYTDPTEGDPLRHSPAKASRPPADGAVQEADVFVRHKPQEPAAYNGSLFAELGDTAWTWMQGLFQPAAAARLACNLHTNFTLNGFALH